ncbi:hypothetical protein ACQZV8_04885 [Magnetococcales bacterium HHB-1]
MKNSAEPKQKTNNKKNVRKTRITQRPGFACKTNIKAGDFWEDLRSLYPDFLNKQ